MKSLPGVFLEVSKRNPPATDCRHASKTAEANLIVRREETAAMRSQVNTAKLIQDYPTLMRLRELEVLEKIATT